MHVKEFEQYKNRISLLFKRIYEDIYTEYLNFTVEYACTTEPVPFEKRLELDYKPIKEGEVWGNPWDSGWFHLKGRVPQSWDGKKIVYRIDMGGEAMLFDKNGVPQFAFSDGNVFSTFVKQMYRVTDVVKGGEEIDLWIEGAANFLFGIKMTDDPHPVREPHPFGHYEPTLKYCRAALFNEELWNMYFDISTLLGLLKGLDFNNYRARQIIAALNKCAAIYKDTPDNAGAAREPLKVILNQHATDSAPSTIAIGHAHLDLGWLWPVRESKRKIARTIATQLDMIERYPGYVYGLSQPQAYMWVKELYPELWKKLKAQVAAGRIEPIGGMWVEADCNLISGESMVRQFLHGKNFYMDEFGIDVKNLWIPDVFGYSASMPQIIRKSGCDYFVTQKISWNQYNDFPYQTFLWKGIDGTDVLTHFPAESTYNSTLDSGDLAAGQNNFKEADKFNEYLTIFGVGDGGGGPSDDFIQRGLRCQNLEGVPKVKFGKASDLLSHLDAYRDVLNTWNGELYLEFHRGTLTTQARTKRNNRKLEQLLTAAEFVFSSLKNGKYPQQVLDRIWKTLMLNQFHDILPGSSIRKVYEVTEKEHAACLEECRSLVNEYVKDVLDSDENACTCINTLSYPYTTPVELPFACERGISNEGKAIEIQKEADGTLWANLDLKASSWTSFSASGKPASSTVKDDGRVLENSLIRYEFNEKGELVSAYDKEAGREVLSAPGNVLSLYNDWPLVYDAWEIEKYYREEYLMGAERTGKFAREVGAVRSTLSMTFTIDHSEITQKVVLGANTKRLDFQTSVEWHESHRMLRVAFPTVVESPEATFDIQYGFVKRPTHNNTSWDWAKFETVGQRYADLTNTDGFGVALLNDCKYGYCIKGSTLDLNLLRSPKNPDWIADQGHQIFTYSLLPHSENLVESDVLSQAAQLNRAPFVYSGCIKQDEVAVPCTVSGKDISLEVVKKAEKSDAIVIRLVETAGRNSKAVLKLNGNYSVEKTNLVEWTNEGMVPVAEGAVEMTLKPFEIVTLKLEK